MWVRLLVSPPENKNCPVTFHACPLSQLQVRRRLKKLRQTLLKSQVSEPVDDAMAFSWLSKGWKEGASAHSPAKWGGPCGYHNHAWRMSAGENDTFSLEGKRQPASHSCVWLIREKGNWEELRVICTPTFALTKMPQSPMGQVWPHRVSRLEPSYQYLTQEVWPWCKHTRAANSSGI